jgi:hypothetical protein
MSMPEQLSYFVMAFSLGVSAGVFSMLLVWRARSDRLRRKLADGGLRWAESDGQVLGSAELMKLLEQVRLLTPAASPARQKMPVRILLVALTAAVAAAAMMLLV